MCNSDRKKNFYLLKSKSQGFREFIEDMTIDDSLTTIYDFADYLISNHTTEHSLRLLFSYSEKWFRERWNQYV